MQPKTFNNVSNIKSAPFFDVKAIPLAIVNTIITTFMFLFIFASSFSMCISNIGFWGVIAFWIYKRIFYKADCSEFSKSEIAFPLFLFLLVNIFSWNFSENPYLSIMSSKNLLNVVIFFAVVDNIKLFPKINNVTTIMIAVNVIVFMLIPVVVGFNLTQNVYFNEFKEWNQNFKGFFSVHITYGTYLVMIILLSLSTAYYTLKTDKNLQRLNYLMLFILILSVGFTSSRSAWLALALSMMVFFISIKRIKYLLMIGLIAFSLFGCGCLFNNDYDIVKNFYNRFYLAAAGDSNGRGYIWQVGTEIIYDNFFTGIGVAGLKKYFPVYSTDKNFEDKYHLHNLFAQILVELGIFGLLAFAFLIIRIFKMCFDRYEKAATNEEKAIALGVLLMTYALFVVGFTEYNFFKAEISRFYWLMLGRTFMIGKIPSSELEEKI